MTEVSVIYADSLAAFACLSMAHCLVLIFFNNVYLSLDELKLYCN